MQPVATSKPATLYKAEINHSYRINSIDLLRGLVMIIMALDHTRDFIHSQALVDDPLNLQTTTPWLFLTRFITHYCAPVFIFLAGTSGFFQSLRKSKAFLSRFLITRGLWLVAVELFIMSFAFTFDPTYSFFALQTIWAIGISMILLGVAIRLPFWAIFSTGFVLVAGHNLLDYYEASVIANDPQATFPLWYSVLHRQGFYPFQLAGSRVLLVLYPLIPWIGLMMLGYCFGRIFTLEAERRVKLLTLLGGGLILLFVALRAANGYGDPQPWSPQKSTLYTFFSFINVAKYPPSLLFLSITIGPALLFLAWAGNASSRLARMVIIFGRVPFFYYILHFFLIHAVATVLFFSRGHSFAEGWNTAAPFKFVLPGEGYSLLVTYIVWIGVVVALYPVCKWFSEYKKTHKQWWLSYI